MVSITSVSAGQASHYYQKDNYYSKEQGEWQGKGAAELGFTGNVSKEDFSNLLEGKSPQGGMLIEGSKANGNEHRAGVDLTFSAPKSVSVLSEIIGDERVREAHVKAVARTLEYIEKNYAQARQTKDGETKKVETGNLVVAKFNHNTSRELDPQMHTHCVVMNMTKREDGQWRALSNEELYNNKMLVGQMYRNELAANLKELGYAIKTTAKGLFEVRGVDQKILDHFSQRKEQIDAKVKEIKESGLYQNAPEAKLREIATLGSRAAKQDVDINLVKDTWQERMKEQGYTKESVQQSVKEAGEKARQAELERKEPKLNEYDYVRLATKAVTEQESTFTKAEILKTAAKFSTGEKRIEDLERAYGELSKDKEIVKLGQDREGKDIYSTKEMQRIEKGIVEKVKDGQEKVRPVMEREAVEKVIAEKYSGLTQGQKEAATHVLTSQDRVCGIQGDAGTGKTTMLSVVREQLEAQGHHVRGLGFTGKAAEEVEKNAGIRSQTIHSFLGSFEEKFRKETEWSTIATKSVEGGKVRAVVAGMGEGGKEIVQKGGNLTLTTDLHAGKQTAIIHNQHATATTVVREAERDNPHGPVAGNRVYLKEDGGVRGIRLAEKDVSKEKQVWVVDEASMVGSRQMHDLIKAAEKVDAKIVLIGDTKQLQSIEAGKMFGKLQESEAMKTVRMNEVLRQKEEGYKDVVKSMGEKQIAKAFEKLEGQNRVHEIAGRGERLGAIVKDFTSGKSFKDTIIVTAQNKDRNELNGLIRDELKAQGKLQKEGAMFMVRESKNLSPTDRHFAQSYKEGDLIIANKAGVMGRAGTDGRVVKVDQENHTITVRKGEKETVIDLKKDGDKISAWEEKRQQFSEGDKVVFLKNNRDLHVQNGAIGIVKEMDQKGNMTVMTEMGKEVKFNARSEYQYIDHGYAVTDYKSQGQTAQKVIYHADTAKGVNYNQAYVGITRGKEDVRVYTDSKEQLKEQVKVEQVKTSTLDYKEIEKGEKGMEVETKMDGKNQEEIGGLRGREMAESGRDRAREMEMGA